LNIVLNDVKKVVEYCSDNLDLTNAELAEEYFYNSLPLCVIDSIFSIGVNYSSVRNTVIRYCTFFGFKRIRDNREIIPPKEEQQYVGDLLHKMNEYGIEKFTENILKNRQRTSAVNGILKTEAVYRFAQVLNDYKVDYLQDIPKILTDYEFEDEVKNIPGQSSGISLKYFFMLAGCDCYIKPDRMILRFLKRVLNKDVSIVEAQILLKEASKILAKDYINMTPRLLDNEIWNFERNNNG